jgi:tellurite methyltransferase
MKSKVERMTRLTKPRAETPTNPAVPPPLVPAPGAPTRPAHLLPAHVYASQRDWPAYFDALGHLAARETLLRAIALFDAQIDAQFDAQPPPDSPRTALDLGCGDGRDTLELLARGWHVTAIDSSREGLARLEARTPQVQRPRLTTLLATFEALADGPALASTHFDLVNASFALPFCPPQCFGALWTLIRSTIKPQGRFAGQFFGMSDDWATLPDRTHHTEEEIRNTLLAGFDIEFWQEENRPTTSTDHPKHWHLFHVVACRRQANGKGS